jgi:adenylate cyclase
VTDFDLVSVRDDLTFRVRGGYPGVLGRGTRGQFTINDSSISRLHVKLSAGEEGLAMEDLESTNGTFLNDARVTKATASDGDVVKFGSVAFLVRRVADVVPDREVEEKEEEQESAIFSDRTVLRAMPVPAPGVEGSLDRELPSAPADGVLAPSRVSRLARLELLLEISKRFSQHVSIDALLESIVDVTCRIMNVHRLSILVVDAHTKELVPLVSRQGGQPAPGLRLPASILKRMLDDKVAVRTDNAAADARFGGKSVVAQNVCGAMCTPMLSSSGEMMGAIYVDNLTAVGSYTDEDLEFLVSFGGIAGAALENSRLSEALRSKAVSLSNFERYFSPEFAAAIASEHERVQLGGVKRPAAILFNDIRGFTALSEQMQPDAVVTMLNDYFSEMVDIVFEHGGALDKFIGDSIMASWGAAIARPDDADRALQAAIEMQRELRAMNAGRAASEPRLEVGIGINWGEVFVGNIGSHRRLEYTVIGDPVNVASRLCSAAGRGEIIISASLLERLEHKPEVETLAPVRLRGRAATTTTYRVRW